MNTAPWAPVFEERVFDSIKELTTAVALGNAEAIAHLFRTRFDQMYAEARRVTGRDESFCLDVVQDAFVRIIRSMKKLDSEARLRAWLKVVVQSCAFDRLRRDARRAQRELVADSRNRGDPNHGILQDRLEWVHNEIMSYGGHDAALLIMRYRLGWTLQRIADFVGRKPGAVDGRIRRSTEMIAARARETYHDS